MSIKVVCEEKKPEIEFPCLMRAANGLVIYAIAKNGDYNIEGITLNSSIMYSQGDHSKTWSEFSFEPIPKGEIIKLQNE